VSDQFIVGETANDNVPDAPAQVAIRRAMKEVGMAGVDARLMDAMILLQRALEKVTEFVNRPPD